MPTADPPRTPEGTPRPEPSVRPQTLRRRLWLALIARTAWCIIQVLGRTWRWRITGYEHFRLLETSGRPVVFAFWHGRILPATFFWRNRGIIVLSSQNADADYSTGIIRLFGYGFIRGSTSRGAVRGTIGLIRAMQKGSHVAFTVDGPRGPIYRVQQGVTWLAAYSGASILPFHIEGRRVRTLASWDRFQIPLPFSEVRLEVGEPIRLPKDTTEDALEEARLNLEEVLDRLRQQGEAWAGRT